MSYKAELQNSNLRLQDVLDRINEMPEGGSGGGGGEPGGGPIALVVSTLSIWDKKITSTPSAIYGEIVEV